MTLTSKVNFILAAGMLVVAAGPALAQHTPPAPDETKRLQGGDHSAWTTNPRLHAFYDLTLATLGQGAPKLDFAAYQEQSYAIFRQFGASMGWKPDEMVEHLKDIPRQVVGIVKDDPKVLDSYNTFTLALMGPQ